MGARAHRTHYSDLSLSLNRTVSASSHVRHHIHLSLPISNLCESKCLNIFRRRLVALFTLRFLLLLQIQPKQLINIDICDHIFLIALIYNAGFQLLWSHGLSSRLFYKQQAEILSMSSFSTNSAQLHSFLGAFTNFMPDFATAVASELGWAITRQVISKATEWTYYRTFILIRTAAGLVPRLLAVVADQFWIQLIIKISEYYFILGFFFFRLFFGFLFRFRYYFLLFLSFCFWRFLEFTK